MTDQPKIEGFEFIEKLGEGPTGEVWKARQVALDRTVALKILHAHIRQDHKKVEQVREEAKAAAQLSHPNFIEVYDICEKDDHIYIVMEYVDGYCINDWLRKGGAVPEKNALLLVENIAFALEYLWSKAGIVHCDLKPGNVIIAQDGTVKVTGPGMAKIAGVTAASVGGINPHYMSPEEAAGEEKIDQRADIYSLGALLYHMVTGKLPFDEPTVMEVIHKLLHDQLPASDDVNPRLRAPTAWLIEKMMAKKRAARQKDWNAVLEDIAQAQGGYLPLGKLPEPGESAVRRSKKRKAPLSETQKLTHRVGELGKISSVRVNASEIRRQLARTQKPRNIWSTLIWIVVRIAIVLVIGAAVGAYFTGGDLSKLWDGVRAKWQEFRNMMPKQRLGPAPASSRHAAPADEPGPERARPRVVIGPGQEPDGIMEFGPEGAEAEETPEPAGPTRILVTDAGVGADQVRLIQGMTRTGRVIGYRGGDFCLLSHAEDGKATVTRIKSIGVQSVAFESEVSGSWKDGGSGQTFSGTILAVDNNIMRYKMNGGGPRTVDLKYIDSFVLLGRAEKVETVSLQTESSLGDHVVWGQVTLFLFAGSDGRGTAHDPARQADMLRQYLRDLSGKHKDVYLRVVEDGTRESAAVASLKLPFMPCVLVFDRIGRRVGNAIASPISIEDYIRRARKVTAGSA
ncbi:MAG: serine/threonine protein kinase [Kiritimatiellae bacterium]|nr:serine/threonine protein kinase [Kiritimatiellia bacterium]